MIPRHLRSLLQIQTELEPSPTGHEQIKQQIYILLSWAAFFDKAERTLWDEVLNSSPRPSIHLSISIGDGTTPLRGGLEGKGWDRAGSSD